MKLGVPFLMLFFSWAYFLRRHSAVPPGFVKKLVIGMIVLMSGALGVEALGNLFLDGSLALTLSLLLEETLEMIGATVMLWAVYDLVGDVIERALAELAHAG